MEQPKICVVVPVYNRISFTKRFLDCFSKSDYQNYKIVIVDDGSKDGTGEFVSQNYPDVKLIKGDGNLWWAGATNLGVKYALENNFDFVLTINDDALVENDYLGKLVQCAQDNPKCIVGSLILRSDNGNVWAAGGYIKWNNVQAINLDYTDIPLEEFRKLTNNSKFISTQILTGDGTLIPIEVFKKVGLYNTTFTPQYHADSEIILRSSEFGFRAIVCLDAILINEIDHNPRLTSKKDIVFSKKSDYYLPSIFYLFMRYAPLKYKIYFVAQYRRFFPNSFVFRFATWLKRFLKRFL